MKHLDLFSGIGGFALAARWAGIETVGFCEIEEYPRKVLAKNFPAVPIHNDIRELDGSIYEGVDIITGGFPCQPFSTCGREKGAKDDRHLWPEMLRIISEARPAWVIAENVSGLVRLGLDMVQHDLEGEGYTSRARNIDGIDSGLLPTPCVAYTAPNKSANVKKWGQDKTLWHMAKNGSWPDGCKDQGVLSRQWVEQQMGYPKDWTKV